MKRILLLCSAVLVTLVAPCRAQFSMSVLAGLKTVTVAVSPLSPDAELFELTEADIEHRVRRALGTTSITIGGEDADSDVPRVVVDVRAIPVRGPSHLYTVEVSLRENVRTERELPGLESFPAATWSKSSVGIANSADAVLDTVSTLVEAFASEHRKENP